MAINLVSTSDTEAEVQAALGHKAPVTEEKPAPETQEEIIEESGTSETEDASELDSKESEAEDDADENKGKKKSGYKRRIDKLTKRVTERDAEIEYWKKEALKTREVPQEKVEKPKTTDDSKKPKPEDFEAHHEYVEALVDWTADKKAKDSHQRQKESQLKESFEKQVREYQSKVAEFSKRHEDFSDVMEDVGDVKMSLAVQQALLESDDGPALAYALAKDPEEYKRICALSPSQAYRAIGRIEAKLQSETAEKPQPKTTKAPKPVNPVGGKSTSPEKNPDEMSMAEYRAWREQKR